MVLKAYNLCGYGTFRENNFRLLPVPNHPSLRNEILKGVKTATQNLLGEAAYLDAFYSGTKPSDGTLIIFVSNITELTVHL